jgi:hypothetical protein
MDVIWRLEGVSSSDIDIEEKNCNTLIHKIKHKVSFRSIVHKGDHYMKASKHET